MPPGTQAVNLIQKYIKWFDWKDEIEKRKHLINRQTETPKD